MNQTVNSSSRDISVLNAAKVSGRTPIFLGFSWGVEKKHLPQNTTKIALKKKNLATTLLKQSVHEVTWKCHQALMHSLSSNLSKIKLTTTWIMWRQCTEWILLAFLISCQVRISCCEVQWGFWLYMFCFSLLSFTLTLKVNFRSGDFLCFISHNLNILFHPFSISVWPQLS